MLDMDQTTQRTMNEYARRYLINKNKEKAKDPGPEWYGGVVISDRGVEQIKVIKGDTITVFPNK